MTAYTVQVACVNNCATFAELVQKLGEEPSEKARARQIAENFNSIAKEL